LTPDNCLFKMALTTFSRKEFYDLIWSESLAAISRKYNISYTCLREVCKEMAIQVPPNGYWSKLQFGKPVTKEPFWKSEKAKQEISLWLRSDEVGEEYFSKNTSALNKHKSEISNKLKSFDNKKIKPRIVDPLIASTKEYYQQKDQKNWDYSKPYNSLDVFVSKTLFPRAIRLMEQFIEMMKVCGHSIIIKNGTTFALVLGEELQLSLAEKSNRITYQERNWVSSRLELNGKLALKYYYLYPQREWVDNTVLLEDKLHDIIAKLEGIAYNRKTEKEEREKYWAEQRILEQKKKELKERKEKELSDFKSIFKLANRFQKSNELRNFINTLEEHTIKNNKLTDELKEWIEWARKKADWYDPFIEAEDPFLNDIDQNSIIF